MATSSLPSRPAEAPGRTTQPTQGFTFLPPTPDPSPELLAAGSASLKCAEPSLFTLDTDSASPTSSPSSSPPRAFDLDAATANVRRPAFNQTWSYTSSLSPKQQTERRRWLASGRGRSGLRVVIVTENFLPKVDGVTRTLSRLLEHLRAEGHEAILLGPETGRGRYAGHPLVGTAGVPLVVYPGLKLNFLRPKFLSVIRDFQPDVIHFVDPIWLGAQVLMAMELGWAGEQWVSADGPALGAGIKGAVVASYHTNLATYATLFGMNWLEPIIWKFQRWLYSKTSLSLCPSPSTSSMLSSRSFPAPHLWPRGVDLELYGPHRRSVALRTEWGCIAPASPLNLEQSSPDHAILREEVPALLLAEKTRMAALQLSSSFNPLSPPLQPGEYGYGSNNKGRKPSLTLPLTPPETPETYTSSPSRVRIGFGAGSGSPGTSGQGQGRGWSEEPEELSLGEAAFRLEEHLVPAVDRTQDAVPADESRTEERAVLIYVGRISWEKNLLLFLSAYPHLLSQLSSPSGSSSGAAQAPKVVFVGDGPARPSLTTKCAELGIDATFCGHQSGEALAERYASGDVFVFPSFTETFGQVILEALASGLPVVGLDAEGTRDLVKHGETGLLLTTTGLEPAAPSEETNGGTVWAQLMADSTSPAFHDLARRYAGLIAELVRDGKRRKVMGARAREGVERGWGWWEAMEKCVDGYRSSLAQSLESDLSSHTSFSPTSSLSPTFQHPPSPGGRTTSSYSPGAVNRVVSRRLAHRDVKRRRLNTPTASARMVGGGRVGISIALKREEGRDLEFEIGLKTLLKAVLGALILMLVYWHHRARVADRGLERILGKV